MISAEELAGIRRGPLQRLLNSCDVGPCVLVLGNVGKGDEQQIVAFLPRRNGGAKVLSYGYGNGAYYFNRGLFSVGQEDLEKLTRGEFRVGPSSLKSIWIGDTEVGAGDLGDTFVITPIQ